MANSTEPLGLTSERVGEQRALWSKNRLTRARVEELVSDTLRQDYADGERTVNESAWSDLVFAAKALLESPREDGPGLRGILEEHSETLRQFIAEHQQDHSMVHDAVQRVAALQAALKTYDQGLLPASHRETLERAERAEAALKKAYDWWDSHSTVYHEGDPRRGRQQDVFDSMRVALKGSDDQ